MERVAPAEEKVVTSEEGTPVSAEPSAPAKAEKPILVYVNDPAAKGENFDKIEKVALKDERVALGSRAFTCVKMLVDDAKADPVISKYGKEAPRFVIVSADYKNGVAIEKVSAGSLWDAMRSASDKFYAKSLDSTVKEMKTLLQDLDKLAGERKTLEEKKTRLEEKGDAKDKKDVEVKLAALDEKQKKLDEKQKSLWALKPKAA